MYGMGSSGVSSSRVPARRQNWRPPWAAMQENQYLLSGNIFSGQFTFSSLKRRLNFTRNLVESIPQVIVRLSVTHCFLDLISFPSEQFQNERIDLGKFPTLCLFLSGGRSGRKCGLQNQRLISDIKSQLKSLNLFWLSISDLHLTTQQQQQQQQHACYATPRHTAVPPCSSCAIDFAKKTSRRTTE